MAITDYRDILVIIQTYEQAPRLHKSGLEALSKARELADQLGARVEAILLGTTNLEELGEQAIHQGADIVLLAEHAELTTGNIDAYFAAVLPVIKERKPEIVLMTANPAGLDLAPRLGAALGTGALSDATKLEIDETDRLLLAKRLTYDGSIEAAATIPKHRPQIASLRPGAVRVGFPDDSRYGRVERVEVNIPKGSLKVKLVALEDAPPRDVPLESAEVVVGAGLGLGKDGIALVEELAVAMGGSWGATRAAVQQGLAPAERHIGSLGKKIQPKLYLAAGISGAFDHYLGVQNAEVIVGINSDPKAAIFRVANYGLVGDAKEIIPAILRELKRG